MPSKTPQFKYTKTDVESVQDIRKLPKDHRGIIARVIWWDWFGGRLASKRTAAFDEWLNQYQLEEPKWTSLVKSLVKCGYPKWLAVRRLQPKRQKAIKAKTN